MIVYDLNKKQPILIAEDNKYYQVLGNCNRCGECCLDVHFNEWDGFKDETGKCNYLYTETVDEVLLHACSKAWNRPFGCALYPWNPSDLNHFLPKCSFSFKEITKEKFISIIEALV